MTIDHLDATVVDLFEVWARSTPEAIAVEWNGKTLSYACLRDASLHVSKALVSIGVRPGDNIPILSQMSLELIPAILGILRVGACYVPIDLASWSTQRVESTLEDISPRVAIATGNPLDTQHVPEMLLFQSSWLQTRFDDSDSTYNRLEAIRRNMDIKSLAYITFTSGTTGKPKGVMIYHQALYQFATLTAKGIHGTTQGQRVMLAFSISFDATVWSTITNGKSLVMASWSTFPQVATTCDSMILTPSMINSMDPTGPYDKVQTIYIGAEPINFDVARQWITPTREVIHTYGPSEATINISYGKIPVEGNEPDLGVLISGVEVFLVDKNMKECECGEILISGPCLAAGYLNNPELTAKKFIDWNGKRAYRTGDLARRTKNGLSYIGRVDHMVKNRGFLVNLETDIQSAVLRFTDVRAACALVWRGKVIVFVQPETVDLEALRVFMKATFDSFVVPDETLAVDQFPLTAHGKVDRHALHARLEDRMAEEDVDLDTMVCNSPYKALQWAFSKCLQVPFKDLDRASSFSRLGGNSLASTRLSKFLRQQGYTIPVTQILREDTIGRLEESLTSIYQQHSTALIADDTGMPIQGNIEAVPVTDLHRLMIVQSQLNPVTNCQLIRARFAGSRNSTPTPSELRTAWTTTLAAHSIFKTRYDLQNWTLHDIEQLNFDWEEVGVEPDEFDSTLLSVEEKIWAQQNSLQSLPSCSLEVPYCRMTCVYTPERKCIGFVWCIHHVLVDIFSSIILVRDLEKALAKEALIPGPRIRDYALFMQRYKLEKLRMATEFWVRMMGPMFEKPMLSFLPPRTTFEGNAWRSLSFTTKETIHSMDVPIQAYKISNATLIFAAWALTLAKYTHSNSVAFGLSRSGRMLPWPAAPDLVGAMNCRVPFATCISAEATVGEWLVEMHDTLLTVAELENLCQSFDNSIYPEETFRTGVQAFLNMPQTPGNWEIYDRLSGQASVLGIVWRVYRGENDTVSAALEIDQRVVDMQWANEVGTVAVQMLEGLANADWGAKLQSLDFLR